jgi:hypothetical protein
MTTHVFTRGSSSALFVVIMLLATAVPSVAATDRTIQYQPEFIQLLQQGRVTGATITSGPSGTRHMRVILTKAAGTAAETVTVEGMPADLTDGQLHDMLFEKGVMVTQMSESESGVSMFASMLPLVIVVVSWIAFAVIVLWLGFRLVRAVERIAENTKK